MRFWDASAVVPLCLTQPPSERVRSLAREDSSVVAWWGTPVECYSAFARLRRSGTLDESVETQAREVLHQLMVDWVEIEPTRQLREDAARLLSVHPLRAADALQLAAALQWAGEERRGLYFVSLDYTLRRSARQEGFSLLPLELQGIVG